jgi:hypothetical protein
MTGDLISAITKLALGCEVSVKPISETRSLATRSRQRKKIWPFFAIALPYCLRSQSREPYWVGRILVAVREEKLIEPNPLIRELLARIRAILRRKVDGTASPVFSNSRRLARRRQTIKHAA